MQGHAPRQSEGAQAVATGQQFAPAPASGRHSSASFCTMSLPRISRMSLPTSVVRRTFVRRCCGGYMARGLFQTRHQYAAKGAQFIELPALFVPQFIQTLNCVFQADQLQFNVDQSLFRSILHLEISFEKRREGLYLV